jgi:hypothetical protein
MRLPLFTVIFLLFFASLNVQPGFGQKCKFQKLKIDKETGDTIQRTKFKTEFIGLNTTFTYQFKKKGDDYFMIINYVKNGFDDMDIFKGDKIIFLLSTKGAVEVEAIKDFDKVTREEYTERVTQTKTWMEAEFSISRDALELLSSDPISLINIAFMDNPIGEPFSMKQGQRMNHEASCILSK